MTPEPAWASRVAVAVLALSARSLAQVPKGAAPRRGLFQHIIVRPASFSYLPEGWSTLSDTLDLLSRKRHLGERNGVELALHAVSDWSGECAAQQRRDDLGAPDEVELDQGEPLPDHTALTGPPAPRIPAPASACDTRHLDGAPQVKEYRVFGRYKDQYDFEVRVDIAAAPPLFSSWDLASRVVARIHFPTWPNRSPC